MELKPEPRGASEPESVNDDSVTGDFGEHLPQQAFEIGRKRNAFNRPFAQV